MNEYVAEKPVIFSWKIFFWRFFFRDEGHLYADYLYSIYHKCFPFKFLGCGICMHILILIGVQSGRILNWKIGHILLKSVLLEA